MENPPARSSMGVIIWIDVTVSSIVRRTKREVA